MNILQILPRLDAGGVETGTIDLSMELVKKGHSVFVVSNGGKQVQALLDTGAKHITLPVDKKSLWPVIKMVWKLRQIIKEEHIDILHARSRVPAIIAFFAAKNTDASFVTTAHGYYSTHILSRVMGWGRVVIVASNIIGRHMIEDFGVPRDRIRFIPRGVDLAKFTFKEIDPSLAKQEYKIGVVGRITPIKGHRFFLEAVARAIKIFPKIKVVIVGDPPKDKPEYKENLKELIRKLDIENFVKFTGSRYDMPKVMSGFDLLVVPSIGHEAFGRVIIEAGAIGVPVIATRIGGALDIVENGKTGLLVEPGNIMEMMEAIVRLLKDRELAMNMAVQARSKVEKEYGLNDMAESVLKVYEDVMNKKNILVIKIGAVGDVILSVPSLRALRKDFPIAHISVMVGVPSRHVLKKCPYIDDLIIYDRKGHDKGIKGVLKLSRLIRRKAFDMSIDLQNNKASHLIAWHGCVKKRYGYINSKFGFLLNNGLKYSKIYAGPIEEQFRVLKKAGVNTIGAPRRLEVWPGKDDFLYVDSFLKNQWIGEKQVLVGFNIGASWKTKRWPLKCFAKLSDMLAEKDIRVVVTGTETEKPLAEELAKMAHSKIINAAGKTSIAQLAALIKRCKAFITGDSAPMHIAASVGVDFIALFGPTDPRMHFEGGDGGKGIVIKKQLACSPCYKVECKKDTCMEKISVDEVYKMVMERI